MRTRYLMAFVLFGILLASGFAYPAYAESEVVLSVDKQVYVVGESVVILGLVQSPSSIPAIVQVWNPDNKACSSQEVNVQDNGSFKTQPILLSGELCGVEGTYSIKVFYGQFEASATFEVQAPVTDAKAGSSRLEILLDILNKARQNVDNKIADYQASGETVPDDINAIYQEGLAQLELTKQAVDAEDANSTRNHAKNTLMAFREVYANLIVLEMGTEPTSVDQAEEISNLRQEITRAIEFKNKLTSIAGAGAVGAVETSFEAFDGAISETSEYLEDGDLEAASQWLEEANLILDDIHKSLIQIAEKQRLENFAEGLENKANMLKEIAETSGDSEALAVIQQAMDLIADARQKASEGDYDITKNLLRQANDLLNQA